MSEKPNMHLAPLHLVDGTDLTPAAVHVEIYDPPMCCPGGLCGPVIDPALLAISEAILKVKAEYGPRVRVDRYILSQETDRFLHNPEVLRRLQTGGAAALPLTTVHGRLAKEGQYPTYAELSEFIEAGLDSRVLHAGLGALAARARSGRG